MLLFVVVFLVFRVLYPVLRVVGALRLLRLLILLAVFVLLLTLLVVGHGGLLTSNRCGTVWKHYDSRVCFRMNFSYQDDRIATDLVASAMNPARFGISEPERLA